VSSDPDVLAQRCMMYHILVIGWLAQKGPWVPEVDSGESTGARNDVDFILTYDLFKS
jgi:hypothetical protein